MMARVQFPRELQSWSLLALAVGAVEGGVAGVLVRNAYAGVVDVFWLNIAVAIVTGAPALANVFSLFWAQHALGQDKIRLIVRCASGTCLALMAMAIMPGDLLGLVGVTLGAVAARVCWCGVITLRSVVWRANYSRNIRARITGRLAIVVSMLMAGGGSLIGFLNTVHGFGWRGAYLVFGLLGLVGAWRYGRIRLRLHSRLLMQERLQAQKGQGHGMGVMLAILHRDGDFRRYMGCLFLMGSGNLMFMAPLIAIINQDSALTAFQQVLVTSSIPLAAMPLSLPLWSRLLDDRHVVAFRARHSWSFVAAVSMFALAAATNITALFWLAALVYGTAMAGGLLGWNLGHNDFAPPEQATQYMGLHVTLTGIRGLTMPLVGVLLFSGLEAWRPGAGRFALLLPMALTTLGAIGFWRLHQSFLKREPSAIPQ
jgi:hypothetical protein